MPSNRKKKFNTWLESVFNNLRDQYISYDLRLDTEPLKNKHWYQLWRIFENHVECPYQGSKELMQAFEVADFEAGKIILNAHNKNYSNLDWEIQMEHYMNSGKYD